MCVNKQSLPDLWKGRKQISHRNDGIILTHNDIPIHTGTSKHVLKWKPSHSIDIKFIYKNTEWKIYANDNSSDDEIEITNKIGNYSMKIEESKLLDHLKLKLSCIVECLLEIQDEFVVLTPERERTDKKTANTMKTIYATMNNAQESISIEELIKHCT